VTWFRSRTLTVFAFLAFSREMAGVGAAADTIPRATRANDSWQVESPLCLPGCRIETPELADWCRAWIDGHQICSRELEGIRCRPTNGSTLYQHLELPLTTHSTDFQIDYPGYKIEYPIQDEFIFKTTYRYWTFSAFAHSGIMACEETKITPAFPATENYSRAVTCRYRPFSGAANNGRYCILIDRIRLPPSPVTCQPGCAFPRQRTWMGWASQLRGAREQIRDYQAPAWCSSWSDGCSKNCRRNVCGLHQGRCAARSNAMVCNSMSNQ
jgi:hypothetical protein